MVQDIIERKCIGFDSVKQLQIFAERESLQMRKNYPIVSSRESDFKIGEYTFEIGGKKKGKKQIVDIPHGVVVRDDIEYGHGNIIPLWHFGLSY